MNDNLFKIEEIKKTIAILKPGNQLFEVRVLQGKKTLSGYFKDAETLVEAFKKVDLRGANVYFTLNFINESCYSRIQRDRFVMNTTTTGDSDIDGYQWMLIDLDPERSTGVSSSNQELQAAADLGARVYDYLKRMGFSEPVKAISGNGYHLLYRINLAKTEENVELVHNCLLALGKIFNNGKVKIDSVNYNPSRICKLHGTLAQKGADSPERPHRMSRIFSNELQYEITDKIFLQRLASEVPAPQKTPLPTRYQAKEFDAEDFLKENGLSYKELSNAGRDGSRIFALDECPFDSTHRDGDAKVFVYPDGAISFKCHHNSCADKRWQDVRLKYDPTAYDKKEVERDFEAGWAEHNRNKAKLQIQDTSGEEVFRTALEIANDDEPIHEFIHSGITEIDNKLNGLQKQSISLMSGLRASGKSTIIGMITLNAINEGHTVIVYSGELSNKKYLNWLCRQAAGKNFTEKSTEYENAVGVPAETKKKIYNWMGDKFWLYNNKFGNNFNLIAIELEKAIISKKADLCIVDNLMILDLSGIGQHDKYDAQTEFVKRLKVIAEKTNCHILFVAHPKKTTGFIRLDDVSGTGNISNIVDNAFMVHRINIDFLKRFKETLQVDPFQKGIPDDATNCIEIAKDRENGTMDYFVPLFYEPQSKRIENRRDEVTIYGWYEEYQPKQVFQEVDVDDEELPWN